jgi:hypothetical protein
LLPETLQADCLHSLALAGRTGAPLFAARRRPLLHPATPSFGAQVQQWSQKNARVDIVAPGADILSTYPTAKTAAAGSTQGFLSYGPLVFNTVPAAFFSGVGQASGSDLADCGAGDAPCPAAKGGVCLVQAKARDAVLADGSKGPTIPTTCELVKACVDSGAEAVVLIPPYDVPRYGPYPRNVSRAGGGGGRRGGNGVAAAMPLHEAARPAPRARAMPRRSRRAVHCRATRPGLGRGQPDPSAPRLPDPSAARTPRSLLHWPLVRGGTQPGLHPLWPRQLLVLERRPRPAVQNGQDAPRGRDHDRAGGAARRGGGGRGPRPWREALAAPSFGALRGGERVGGLFAPAPVFIAPNPSPGPLTGPPPLPPSTPRPPKQGEKIRSEMKAAAAAKRTQQVTVKAAPYPYRRLSGTSMAT